LPTCRKQLVVPMANIAPEMITAVKIASDSLFDVRQVADWTLMRRAAGYPRDAFEWGNSVDRSDLFAVMPTLLNHMETVGRSGSLTQHLVQTIWYPPDNGLFRKAREIRLTNRVASSIGKDRILELYLNVAEFGPGIYGVEAASQAYFGISASKLTKVQAATLAATLATPRSSTPTNKPEVMRKRQALILRRLNGEAVTVPTAFAASDSTSNAP
jgi:membrane carboxypeptidase/penicillin-binding protein